MLVGSFTERLGGASLAIRVGIALVVGALYLGGAFKLAELKLLDARFALVERPANPELTLVAIDPQSLRQIGYWPWPRSLHAFLMERLTEAGAARVAFDIDFSSQSRERDDAALEQAFANLGGQVILPGFLQNLDPLRHDGGLVSTLPLERFRRHAEVASVNVIPDTDGLVRRMSITTPLGGLPVPTLSARLAEVSGENGGPFTVDFGIRLEDMPTISYVDVIVGNFDRRLVQGRTVLVGTTAFELGDVLTVPVYGALPGVMFQALAAESLRQGRMLTFAPEWIVLIGTAALCVLLGPLLSTTGRRQGLILTLALPILFFFASCLLQAAYPVMLEIIPWTVALVLVYVAGLSTQLQRQSVSLLAHRLALIRKEKFMARVVENSFDAIITADSLGAILSFNRAATEVFGYELQEAAGRPISELIYWPQGDGSDPVHAQDLKELSVQRESLELRGRRRDGYAFTLDVAITAFRNDERDTYVLTLRNVTAKKDAESAAEQAHRQAVEAMFVAAKARQQLVDAIESVSEGFVLWDRNDRLVMCNAKYRELAGSVGTLVEPGVSFERVIRAFAAQNVQPKDDETVEDWVRWRLALRQQDRQSYERQRPDGRWVRVSERRTSDGSIVSVLRDITEDKNYQHTLIEAKERAEAADLAKSRFLATMSHELRTPLNAILGFSEIIKEQALGPVGNQQYQDYASDIHDSGNHLLSVINDVLDVAKIETGNIELYEEEFSLDSVLRAGIRMMRSKAEAGGVALEGGAEAGLVLLRGDERLIKQSVLNVLSNAVKFTPHGGCVRVALTRDHDGRLAVVVADTGIGIASEDIPAVLEPFRQIDNSLSRNYEGTGLGLPLTKGLVELHGGSLEIDSAVGAGTTVTLRFPAERLVSFDGEAAVQLAS